METWDALFDRAGSYEGDEAMIREALRSRREDDD